MKWFALLLTGCAARATYVPLDQPLPPSPEQPELVETNVALLMERGRMPALTWSPRTDIPPVAIEPDELDKVPPEALWMAWVCSPRRMWGSELDLLVSNADGKVPLTVQIEADGAVHLSQGEAPPELVATRTDREAWMAEIARRHGLAGIVDGDVTWSNEELDAASRALELLDPREIALLEDLLLSRDHQSPRSPRELALYDPLTDPVTIHVYDGAFGAGSWSFVGDPGSPVPASVMTLVHEFGHVLSDAPVAASWRRYSDALEIHLGAAPEDRGFTRAHLRAAKRDMRQIGRRGPVIDDFARMRPGRLWPTSWSTDVFESFAEAFALYRTDPEALLRVAPEAHAWFERDGHLAWRGFGD